MMNQRHAVIVGGGISGLSVAYELSRMAALGKPPWRVTLLEAQDRFGGVIRTFDQHPCPVEAAADAFYGDGPRGSEVVECCGALGLSGELVEASPSFRRFFILKDQTLVPFPGASAFFNPVAFFSSPALSLSAKARLFLEPWIARNKNPGDESIGHFFRRRLGAGFYQQAVCPVLRGVYMADPEELSLEAVFPGLRKREQAYGSLAKAAWADRFAKGKKGSERFLSLKKGLESLVRAWVREMSGCELRTASPVFRWGRDGTGGYVVLEGGEILRADVICLAMNAADAAPLLREADAGLSGELAGIRYSSILTFNFIFKTAALPRQMPDTGFIVPACGASRPFSSLKLFDPVPDGKYRGVRVFIAEAMLPEIFGEEDGIVEKKVLGELHQILGTPRLPEFSVAGRYPRALPCYEVGHCERIARIAAGLQKHSGLFLTGNGFCGFGIADCIHAAKAATGKILEYVGSL